MDCPILKDNERLEERHKADDKIIKDLKDALREMLRDAKK